MKGWITVLSRRVADLSSSLIRPRRRHSRELLAAGRQPFGVTEEADDRDDPAVIAVPNTRIAPHPEHLPVAVLEFDDAPHSVPIMRGKTVIGRHSEDDVRIRDVRISRHHARLLADSERFEIENLTAMRSEPNPMLVNGTSRERAEVVDGDVITLGGVRFVFRSAQRIPTAQQEK
ncbi:MAG: FHA domain-containing protein [Hyphomicrobiaceae bacterium]